MVQLSDRWEFYRDRLGEWQWRKFEAKKVVAVSADGFYSRQACINNARQRGYEPVIVTRPRKQRETITEESVTPKHKTDPAPAPGKV